MLRRFVAILVLVTLCTGNGAAALELRSASIAATGSLQAAFSPWDDIEGMIVEVIASAKKQVLVQAYVLTNRPITKALIAAKKRGVSVMMLVDANQFSKDATARVGDLLLSGIPVWTETKYHSAHNKVMVIDASLPNATVITGSFNFSWSAQHRNAENVLFVRNNPALAERYVYNWERHRREATQLNYANLCCW